MQVIEISGVTGHSPYNIVICDVTNSYCYTVESGVVSIPPTLYVNIPTQLNGVNNILIKIIDSSGCETFQYAACPPTQTPTPTNTLTPTITPTNANCICLIFKNPTLTIKNYSYINCNTQTVSYTLDGETEIYVCGKNPTYDSGVILSVGPYCYNNNCVPPTPTPTQTPTNTPTPTPTPTNTLTPTPTPTNTLTPTPTVTETPTNTPTPTVTETPTNTPTPSVTETPTNTPTPTVTETPTNTPTNTLTPTPTSTLPCYPGADYVVFTYEFPLGAGVDLDTLTTLINPTTQGPLGYCGSGGGGGPYLYWGGDNTESDGSESVYVDLIALKLLYPSLTSFDLTAEANWFTSVGTGIINIKMFAYSGGTMSNDGNYGFINTGGVLLANRIFPQDPLTLFNDQCTSTQCIGTFSYNITSGCFTKNPTCLSVTPTPTMTPTQTPTQTPPSQTPTPTPTPPTLCPNCVSGDITIGTQVWSKCNLDVTTYRDNTPIPQVTDPTAWAALTTGAWCWYANNSANGPVYGKLYNWHAVNDTLHGGLAPVGYHVPTDAEWTVLTDYLGGLTVAGGKMKEVGFCHWLTPNTDATNTSLFTGLPGGVRNDYGTFNIIGRFGYWWSSTDISTDIAWNYNLLYDAGYTGRNGAYKKHGFSVRLIKD